MAGDQPFPSYDEERLPPPLADFVIYSKGNAVFMRYAPSDIDDVGRRIEIALPEISLKDSLESPRAAFIRLHDHVFCARQDAEKEAPRWEHACGYTMPVWENGSEQGLRADLASIIRVIADRHDVQVGDGLVLVWAYSRTPSSEARLGLESYEIFATKSLAEISRSLRDEFIGELRRLETGLLARNRPAGCCNKRSHSGGHSPMRFVVPIEVCADTMLEIPGPFERYAQIAAAARSDAKTLN